MGYGFITKMFLRLYANQSARHDYAHAVFRVAFPLGGVVAISIATVLGLLVRFFTSGETGAAFFVDRKLEIVLLLSSVIALVMVTVWLAFAKYRNDQATLDLFTDDRQWLIGCAQLVGLCLLAVVIPVAGILIGMLWIDG